MRVTSFTDFCGRYLPSFSQIACRCLQRSPDSAWRCVVCCRQCVLNQVLGREVAASWRDAHGFSPASKSLVPLSFGSGQDRGQSDGGAARNRWVAARMGRSMALVAARRRSVEDNGTGLKHDIGGNTDQLEYGRSEHSRDAASLGLNDGFPISFRAPLASDIRQFTAPCADGSRLNVPGPELPVGDRGASHCGFPEPAFRRWCSIFCHSREECRWRRLLAPSQVHVDVLFSLCTRMGDRPPIAPPPLAPHRRDTRNSRLHVWRIPQNADRTMMFCGRLNRLG